MELRELIERGTDAAGSQRALAVQLGVLPQDLTSAKAGRRGLPIASCFQLAELIGEDPAVVVAASELVTEKKPERRAVLLPFAMRHAAVITMAAGVTLLLTPMSARAAAILELLHTQSVLC